MRALESLVLVAEEPSQVQRRFSIAAADLSPIVPWAEVVHVGSTAVPGCLTKGDIDVLVRVYRADFGRSMKVLDSILTRSPRNEATDDYVEYDYERQGISASVQLVVAGAWHDLRFHGLRKLLLSDPTALGRYNQMKRAHEGRAMSDYRSAKSELIESMLGASDDRDSVEAPVLLPGVHD